MRKFLNGEREYKKGDIVFFIKDQTKCLIQYGKIDTYVGNGYYYITIYSMKECRTINDTPIKDVDFNKKYKLPKKYSYNTELFKNGVSPEYFDIIAYMENNEVSETEKIINGIKNGMFVPVSETFLGHVSCEIFGDLFKYIRVFNNKETSLKVNVSEIFTNIEEAVNECLKREKIIKENNEIRKNWTDEEWFRYELRLILNRIKKQDAENLNNIESYFDVVMSEYEKDNNIDVRLFDNHIQIKTENVWKNLIHIKKPECKPTEKYFVNIYYVWDMDKMPIVKGYYNEKDALSFLEKYNNPEQYCVTVASREWNIEKGFEIPAYSYLGVEIDPAGYVRGTIINHYTTQYGFFEITKSGKLKNFDISIDKKYSFNNFFISVNGNTSKSVIEIKEWFNTKTDQIFGKFSDLFKDKIETLDVKWW